MSVALKIFGCCIILHFMALLLHKQDTENLCQKGDINYFLRTMIAVVVSFPCWRNTGLIHCSHLCNSNPEGILLELQMPGIFQSFVKSPVHC